MRTVDRLEVRVEELRGEIAIQRMMRELRAAEDVRGQAGDVRFGRVACRCCAREASRPAERDETDGSGDREGDARDSNWASHLRVVMAG